MKRTVKICACINEVAPLNPAHNLKTAIAEIRLRAEGGADLMVLPPLFLTGGELAGLSGNSSLLGLCRLGMESLAKEFSKERFAVLAGVPGENGTIRLALAFGGHVRYDLGGLLRFEVQGNHCVAAVGAQGALARCAEIAGSDADVFIVCDYSPATAGIDRIIENNLLLVTRSLGISCCFVRGGRHDTPHPNVYRAAAGFCRDGNEVQFYRGEEAYGASASLGGVLSDRPLASVIDLPATKPLAHPVEIQKQPFIPLGMREDAYCLDLFDLQCRSLADRLYNLRLEKVVLGVSGGLDSCLALLVAAGAMDLLGLPHQNILALLMPGFGTSPRTRDNAQLLCEGVGATVKLIDITPSVRATFEAIGHEESDHSVVFENAQARQRTAIALNIANQQSAIMVGTGDLSEEALGFSTYGGDQMASYNVNVCIPKSIIRLMLPIITQQENFAGIGLVVRDILDTPISPELLPGNGEIVQKTEDILAPYALLDFYLYCFAAAHLNRARTLEYAAKYFGNSFSAEYLAKKLDLFYAKFIAGQFKRSCAPEAARITCLHLLEGGMWLPSDMSPALFAQM